MNNKENQSKQSIFVGTTNLLNAISKIAAGFVGLSGFAYIVGWIYAQSYFSVFGAKWLITEIPVLTLMGYSWLPVLVVVVFAYTGITELAEIEQEGNVKDSRQFKFTLAIFKHGSWVFGLVAITDLIFSDIGNPALAKILSFINVVIVIGMVRSALMILSLHLVQPVLRGNLSVVYLTYAVIAFGLYFTPMQMGRNAALLDKEYDALSLPFVTLRDNPTKTFKLLALSGEHFYIFPTIYDSIYPPIQIVVASQIQSIQKKSN